MAEKSKVIGYIVIVCDSDNTFNCILNHKVFQDKERALLAIGAEAVDDALNQERYFYFVRSLMEEGRE